MEEKRELKDLPPELLSQGVFKYLSPYEVVATESVCKWWRELCRSPSLWHYFCSVEELGHSEKAQTENSLDPETEKVPHP